MKEFLSNPIKLTAKDLLQEEKMPLAVIVACWCGGLLICWLGGWAKANFKYSVFSSEVLSATLLCVLISTVSTLVFARTNRKLHWKIASAVFAVSAWGIAGWFLIGSH